MGLRIFSVQDIQKVLYKERKIDFKTCPVGGHNYHGSVERRLRTIQESLEKAGIFEQRLHATGLQTVMKLIENDFNNQPLGYMYGRDADNSPLLKLIFPNMLRIGRNNTRSLMGPIRLPKSPKELMDEVVIPKLMKQQNKWFSEGINLKIGDIVFFQKHDGDLASRWSIGCVDDVEKSKDEVVRRVSIRYRNHNEDVDRFTDRAARSCIKLFHIDDTTWRDDVNEVEKLLAEVTKAEKDDASSFPTQYVMNPVRGDEGGLRYRLTAVGGYRDVVALERGKNVQYNSKARVVKMKYLRPCKRCCCFAHCSLADNGISSHGKDVIKKDVDEEQSMTSSSLSSIDDQQSVYNYLWDYSWSSLDEFEEEVTTAKSMKKTLNDVLCSVHVSLDGVNDRILDFE